MENGATVLTDMQLIKERIWPNIPYYWKKDFEMQGGKSKTTIKVVSQIIQLIRIYFSWKQIVYPPKYLF